MSFRQVSAILWRDKILLLTIPLVVTGAVAVAAFSVTPRFDATITLLPVSDSEFPDRAAGLGGAGASIGGLASLAGLSGAGNSLKVEALATLESESLTERFIAENNLLPVLYEKKWDAEKGRWRAADAAHIPTLWKANRLFRDRVRNVIDHPRTGLVTMTITWRDPELAAKWANGLVAMTNQYLRDKAISDAEKNIDYLQGQARTGTVVSVQAAVANLTESQMKRVMYARSRDQYALKVLDPAIAPELRSFPQRSLWIASAALVSIFLALFVALLRGSNIRSVATPRVE